MTNLLLTLSSEFFSECFDEMSNRGHFRNYGHRNFHDSVVKYYETQIRVVHFADNALIHCCFCLPSSTVSGIDKTLSGYTVSYERSR